MDPRDLLAIKRDGGALSKAQSAEFLSAYTAGEVADYHAAVLLTSIFIHGMEDEELTGWTRGMIATGRTLSFESDRPIVDKHSTGGVGDKVSIPLAPALAACGCSVPMISGRGLGHTGGTLDKLEAIPGYRTDLSGAEMDKVVSSVGCVITGQTADLVPADRTLYDLRSRTATVPSIDHIAPSILSKKLAEGISALVLDVKCGAGAVFSDPSDANTLARALVDSGTASGLPTVAIVTDMAVPLGRAVGNAVEVAEAIECLQGDGPEDLRELSVHLVARMLLAGGVCDEMENSVALVSTALDGGAGLERFERMLVAQGGDARVIDEPERLGRASGMRTVEAERDGWLSGLDALQIGRSVARLGGAGGRGDGTMDLLAGIRVLVPVGVQVAAGDALLELQSADVDRLAPAAELARAAVVITDEPGVPRRLVLGTIGADSPVESDS